MFRGKRALLLCELFIDRFGAPINHHLVPGGSLLLRLVLYQLTLYYISADNFFATFRLLNTYTYGKKKNKLEYTKGCNQKPQIKRHKIQ